LYKKKSPLSTITVSQPIYLNAGIRQNFYSLINRVNNIQEFKKYKMKKIFFAILAISMLSTSFAFAGSGKRSNKKVGKKTECPKDCPRTIGCGH
jgi:hypothetical protein